MFRFWPRLNSQRQKGHGSILVSLLIQVRVRIHGTVTLSSTQTLAKGGNVLDVSILAMLYSERQTGHGSILVDLLIQVRMRIHGTITLSSTQTLAREGICLMLGYWPRYIANGRRGTAPSWCLSSYR